VGQGSTTIRCAVLVFAMGMVACVARTPSKDVGSTDSGRESGRDGAIHAGHDAGRADARQTDATALDARRPTDAGAAAQVDATVDAGVDAGGIDASFDAPDGCSIGLSGEPTDLSCTGLYSDWVTKTVAAGMHVYDPGLHLWSDGADKTRWISLPAGQPIDTSNMDEWTFPVGTKVWKQFVLEGTLIETRMIWKRAVGSWVLTTYRWSADLTSATELLDGEPDADGHGYEIPSGAECHECHDGRLDTVLGFEAVALSSPNAALARTSSALAPLTLSELVDAGWLTAAPANALTVPGSPTAAAALGYLHMNCGTACHNHGNGAADETGFFMRLDVGTLAAVATTDAVVSGVFKVAGYSIPGQAVTYRLAPGNVPASAAHYRMSVRDGVDGVDFNQQMPPFDTHRPDDAGVAAVGAWIEAGCGD